MANTVKEETPNPYNKNKSWHKGEDKPFVSSNSVYFEEPKNRLFESDDILEATAEDGVITLSIYKARVSDIGVYRCAARNQFGISITKAKLTVGDTPDRPTVRRLIYYLF